MKIKILSVIICILLAVNAYQFNQFQTLSKQVKTNTAFHNLSSKTPYLDNDNDKELYQSKLLQLEAEVASLKDRLAQQKSSTLQDNSPSPMGEDNVVQNLGAQQLNGLKRELKRQFTTFIRLANLSDEDQHILNALLLERVIVRTPSHDYTTDFKDFDWEATEIQEAAIDQKIADLLNYTEDYEMYEKFSRYGGEAAYVAEDLNNILANSNIQKLSTEQADQLTLIQVESSGIVNENSLQPLANDDPSLLKSMTLDERVDYEIETRNKQMEEMFALQKKAANTLLERAYQILSPEQYEALNKKKTEELDNFEMMNKQFASNSDKEQLRKMIEADIKRENRN